MTGKVMLWEEWVTSEALLDAEDEADGHPIFNDEERVDPIGLLHHSESHSVFCHDTTSRQLMMFGGE